MAKFHHYSLRNVMRIAMQKPAVTQVADFHAWHRFGYFVKKGDKDILIIARGSPIGQTNAGFTFCSFDSN